MNTYKQKYKTPKIECIVLDNEISLTLDSTPPIGPGDETVRNTPEYLNNDPFKATYS